MDETQAAMRVLLAALAGIALGALALLLASL